MKTNTYCVRYYHKGVWRGTEIEACDWDDAEALCKRLGMQLDGRLVMKTKHGWLAKLILGFRVMMGRG